MVRKEYRNTRAAFQIHSFVAETLPGMLGIDAEFGEVVCNHVITQKLGLRAETFETGIELDLMPGEAYEHDAGHVGRVAALLMFRVFNDRPHDIYVPGAYAEIVKRSIGKLGLSRSVTSAEEGVAGTGEILAAPHYYEEAAIARLTISNPGADAGPAISDFESTASQKGCCVRQVFLNIGDPAAGDVFRMLFSKGYFFGGYLPRWFDSDGFLLQKLTRTPAVESMKLYSDWAKELLEFTLRDRTRASGQDNP